MFVFCKLKEIRSIFKNPLMSRQSSDIEVIFTDGNNCTMDGIHNAEGYVLTNACIAKSYITPSWQVVKYGEGPVKTVLAMSGMTDEEYLESVEDESSAIRAYNELPWKTRIIVGMEQKTGPYIRNCASCTKNRS